VVSVIICTYNRSESLKDTLQALKVQKLPDGVSLEIIIVDNNSSDSTHAVVIDSEVNSPWPVHYLFEPTPGKCFALNRGIKQAKGELIALTDDDTIPGPDWVNALWAGYKLYAADCTGGRILPLWVEKPPSWLMKHTVCLQMLAMIDHGDAPAFLSSFDPGFLFGANMAYRKKTFDDVGLFNTDLGPKGGDQMRGEDTDMLERFVNAGKRIAYIPGAIVYHKVPKERMSRSYFRRWRFESGRATCVQRGMKNSHFPLWLLRECFGNFFQAIYGYAIFDSCRAFKAEMIFWFQCGEIIELTKDYGTVYQNIKKKASRI